LNTKTYSKGKKETVKHQNLFALILGLAFIIGATVNVARQSHPGEHVAPQYANAPKGTPQMILTYQGRPTDKNGVPINSTVSIVFKLYDVNGTAVWTSDSRTITPVNGLFTVYLGDSNDSTSLHPSLNALFASIGVTVGNDSEMTPHQPLNSVYGYSASDYGVWGYSQGGYGVTGVSQNMPGMMAVSISSTLPALMAMNMGGGPSLILQGGNIQIHNAGVDTLTPLFMHQVITGAGVSGTPNTCAPFGVVKYATIIDNSLINGNSDAILIITPNFRKSNNSQSNSTGPAKDIPGVFYSVSGGCGNINKWVIYNLNAAAMVDNTFYNVMVVTP
jgi:hypothetical protein